MMQRGYKPDGWLGAMVGAKLYIILDEKCEFEKAYKMLLKEIGTRGRTGVSTNGKVIVRNSLRLREIPSNTSKVQCTM